MEDDEAVVVVVALLDQARQGLPERGLDVGRIDERVEGVGVDLHRELPQLGHLLEDAAEVEGTEGAVLGVFFHPDGAAGVDQQDGRLGCLFLEEIEIQLHMENNLFAFAVVAAATSSRLRPFWRATKAAMMGM